MRCAQDISSTRGKDAGGMHGGARRRQRSILERLWLKYFRKKRVGNRERYPHSRSQGKIGEADREVMMLGRRQATTRWVNDLVWKSEILGWR